MIRYCLFWIYGCIGAPLAVDMGQTSKCFTIFRPHARRLDVAVGNWRNAYEIGETIMDLRAIAFILFILMYVIMIAKPNWKIYAIWGVAIVFMLVGILRPNPLYILSVINWNVLMMIGGTMLVVWFFIESKMPNLLADIILDKCANVMWVIILMSLFAGAVSAFIDNVATVLMIAPVALAVCKKLDI